MNNASLKIQASFLLFTWIWCACESESKNKHHFQHGRQHVTKEKNDTGSSTSDGYKEDYAFAFQKSEWGKRNGKGTFLYSLKVDQLVQEKLQSPGETRTAEVYNILDAKTMETLSTKDLVYYCLAYPGSFGQTCISYPVENGIVPLNVPGSGENRSMNDLQIKMVLARKDSVSLILKKIFLQKPAIDVEYLHLTSVANLVELIPILCKKADLKNNPFIYSLLIELLEHNHDEPYQTEYYNKLRENVQSNGFHIRLTREVEENLKRYALRFYNEAGDTLR